VGEIGPHRFRPGNLTMALMDDYAQEVRPRKRAA
jgi:branched-chain amino acid aminotransferase